MNDTEVNKDNIAKLKHYMEENQDSSFSVYKAEKREANKLTWVPVGMDFYGCARVYTYPDGKSVLMINEAMGDNGLRTSVLVDAVQDSPNKWVLTTLNSIYHLTRRNV